MFPMYRSVLLVMSFLLGLSLVGQANKVELNVGDEAPEFTLPGSDGEEYTLSELLEQGPVVLAWFPKADTPGCTAQCKDITSNGRLIREYNVSYFMISVDTPEDNQKFAEKYNADFPILSDADKSVAKQYGVLSVHGWPARHTFYIGKDGKILEIDQKVKTKTAAADMAAILAELEIEKIDTEVSETPET